MRIKKLILHGFKSFADRTEFEFKEGITAIVGPNGCGKSNVVDAIKWVLGEQKPTSLRGKEMLDVIFSGTSARKGLGVAEVSLVLDNSAKTLAIDFEEVVVTRRLYRSGESEYLINGNAVRLRDVRELMMDSGGGPGSVSVMEQGNIDRLLRADPIERRGVFEEAAGISKYRSRRVETERKLERTAENLARLKDILAENETRERSLKIQASKARRYKELTDELKKKRVTGALARYGELRRKREAAQAEMAAVEAAESEARAALAEAMESTEERRKELDALRERVSKGEAEMAALAGEQRASQEKEAAREREATDLLSRAGRAERALADARKRAAELEADLAPARAEHEGAAAEEARRAEALAAAEALFAEALGRVEVLRRERDALDLRRTEAYGAETEARNEQITCEAELKALGQRRERLLRRVEEAGTELRSLEEARQESSIALKGCEERLRELEERSAAAEEAVKRARGEADDASADVARLSGEAAALVARRDLLRGLVTGGEGLSTGTRALLEAGFPGTRGTVADLAGYAGAAASALDQALGDLAGAVVVDTTEQAIACLAWLREGERGRARIVPLDRVRDVPLPQRFEHVVTKAPGLLGALLSRTVVAETIEDALDVGAGWRVVVLTGEEIEPNGAIVGGTGDAGQGLVRRNAELADVLEVLSRVERDRAAGEKKLAEARRRGADWESQFEELRPLLGDARAQLREASEAMAAAGEAAAARAQEMGIEEAEQEDVERAIGDAEKRLEAATASLVRASKRREEMEEGAGDLRTRLQRAAQEREESGTRLTDCKVSLARFKEKASSTAQRVKSLEDAIAGALREADAQAEEERSCLARRAECEDEIETLKRLAHEREKTLSRLGADVEVLRRSALELQQGLQRGGERLRELQGLHEERRHELERHRMREQELKLRLETLLDEVRRDYGLELAALEAGAEEATADPARLEQEITELREKLERLGNVNHAALEELKQVEEKLAFLRREEADLAGAEKQLRETIEKIDTICRERFLETFEKVKELFQVTFRKLFGGGKAELFLENPEDVLGSGVEIRVRPPGKELRTISLLSGGERSLATVALLFSVYQIKPPPFCLLDEVDAALDEANSVRMCEMLKEFARRAQFLVITHARSTMTAADTLYGVTMPEAGVSRHVAVRFADIEAGRVIGLN
jgi:chromosome segregation protein